MRFIRYLFYISLALMAVVIALANRGAVTLTLLPEELVAFSGISHQIELPLYLVIFGAVLIGVLIGYILEWLREHKFRRDLIVKDHENMQLKQEVRNLQKTPGNQKDDVLAIIE